MPRHISFMLTTPQFVDGSKDVTRRIGWANLKAGDVLIAVEKSQGLGKGGKVKKLGMIRVKSARREPLRAIHDDLEYGYEETRREGFPEPHAKNDPTVFIEFFCKANKAQKCTPETIITRIEFERIGAAP